MTTPLTMTAEEEATIRRADEAWGPVITHAETVRDRRLLLAEIDALRRLPVIATCGECAHLNEYESIPNCAHPDIESPTTVSATRVATNDVPPDWCPLRGAR